jgi:hypothetical protein
MIGLVEFDHGLVFLFGHDLFGKPVPTFPDHAGYPTDGTARSKQTSV